MGKLCFERLHNQRLCGEIIFLAANPDVKIKGIGTGLIEERKMKILLKKRNIGGIIRFLTLKKEKKLYTP